MSRCADEKLIETVCLYEHLYNTSDKNYHDALMKENSWREIASTLQSSVAECKKKWFSIRDNYRKSLKKQKSKSEQAANLTKPYKYADILSFLKPHIGEREQRSNIVLVENTEEDHELDDDPTSATEPRSPEESTPVRESQSVIDLMQQRPHIETVLHNYFKYKADRTGKRGTKDHLTKFFEAMEETVRTFNPHMQVEVKKQISSIVMEYEIKHLNEVTLPLSAQPSPSISASSGSIYQPPPSQDNRSRGPTFDFHNAFAQGSKDVDNF